MKILFSRSNLARKEKFQIITYLIEKNDKLIIKKEANHRVAIKHLNELKNTYQTLKEKLKKIELVRIIGRGENFIEFEYQDQPTLESMIEKALIEKNFSLAKFYLKKYLEFIDAQPTVKIKLSANKNFLKIFDPNKQLNYKKEECLKIGLLDLNLDNLIFDKKNKKLFLFDWEWFFDFPLSKEFLIFRSVLYLCAHLQLIIKTYCSENFPCVEILRDFYIPEIFFEEINFLTPEKIEKFLIWENNFQNYVNNQRFEFNKKLIMPKFEVKKEKILKTRLLILDQEKKKMEEEIEKENEKSRNQINETKINITNLENTLNMIKSAKFFKLWQVYCKIMKFLRLKSEKV
jgi:hypothetical protein